MWNRTDAHWLRSAPRTAFRAGSSPSSSSTRSNPGRTAASGSDGLSAPGSGPWQRNGVRLFNVATTRVQHRLYVIVSRERVLSAKPGTALGHLGTLIRDRQVRRLPAASLISPT